MALFQSNTQSLFSGALLRTLGNSTTVGPFTLGVTIYSGTPPTAEAVASSWSLYNSTSASYLVHYTNMVWAQPGTGPLLQMTTAPTPQTPVNNGTATWAIIWAGAPTAVQLANSTLPLSNFLLVSVSDAFGDGVIRFSSTTLSTSAAHPVLDGSMASFI